jgi:hypothetical protein
MMGVDEEIVADHKQGTQEVACVHEVGMKSLDLFAKMGYIRRIGDVGIIFVATGNPWNTSLKGGLQAL